MLGLIFERQGVLSLTGDDLMIGYEDRYHYGKDAQSKQSFSQHCIAPSSFGAQNPLVAFTNRCSDFAAINTVAGVV